MVLDLEVHFMRALRERISERGWILINHGKVKRYAEIRLRGRDNARSI